MVSLKQNKEAKVLKINMKTNQVLAKLTGKLKI